jgi:type II secretion system (T2SS) protein C
MNVALLAASVSAAAYVARELHRPQPRPAATRARPAQTAPAPNPGDAQPAKPPPGTYQVVATRNLFSPTRTETPPAAVAAKPVPVLPKPNLFGVVLREGTPIAYLEDPTTKRVAGYRIGDAVAGGTVKGIEADHVLLTRPEGQVDVRLRDPSRPRPAAPPPSVVPGAAPGSAPGIPQPGPQVPAMPPVSLPPAQPGVPPRSPAVQQQPPVQPQPQAVQQPGAPEVQRPPFFFSRRRPPGLPNNAQP